MNRRTTLLEGKDAAQYGSVLAAFNSNGRTASWLMLRPREQHPADERIPSYRDWRTEKRDIVAQIPQVEVPSSQRVYSTLREWRFACLLARETSQAPRQGVDWDGPYVVVPRNRLGLSWTCIGS